MTRLPALCLALGVTLWAGCEARIGELPRDQAVRSMPGKKDAGQAGADSGTPLPGSDAGTTVPDAGGGVPDSGTGGVVDAGLDADPLAHVKFLSSDSMKGRDSPSTELDAAADYVIALLKRHGVEGPNNGNAANPYLQPFTLRTFAPTGFTGHFHPHTEFGTELFEYGFYVSRNVPQDTAAALKARYEAHFGVAAGAQATSLEDVERASFVAGTVNNVVGRLGGTGPKKNEVIVLMAHLDHVGVGTGGVYNGADDNASGSAVVLAAVPALAAAKQRGELNRSIVFLWTAAEEKGLVGAKYFADNPLPGVSGADIVGVVNLDMVGRWDDKRLSVIDSSASGTANYFRGLLDTANKGLASPFDRINRDINSYRSRQDGAAFPNEDVLTLFEGLSNASGGGDLIPEYHRTGDDVSLILRDNGGAKLTKFRDLLTALATLSSNR